MFQKLMHVKVMKHSVAVRAEFEKKKKKQLYDMLYIRLLFNYCKKLCIHVGLMVEMVNVFQKV